MRPIETTVIGNLNVDLLVRPVTTLPPPGEEWLVDRMDMRPGGAGANSGLTLAGLEVPCRLVGCVGDDSLGSWLLDRLAAADLERDLTVVPGARTGISVAFEAPGRDRSFLMSLGSLSTFDRDLIPSDALSAGSVLMCGYFTLPALRGEPTMGLLREARAAGATTLFDTGWDPAGFPEPTRTELRSVLPLVDVFLPNEKEAAALTGETDPKASARALQRITGGVVIVKLGPGGCVASAPAGECSVPAPPVEALDTTGAGDAFNAGFLAAGSGVSLEVALAFAVRVASTVVSRPSSDRYPSPGELR